MRSRRSRNTSVNLTLAVGVNGTVQMIEELKSFNQTGSKEDLIGVVVRVLDLVGGKLYEGYSRADTVPRA